MSLRWNLLQNLRNKILPNKNKGITDEITTSWQILINQKKFLKTIELLIPSVRPCTY